MQLRTFSAKSTADVLAQIREELGSDAVILDTKEEDGVISMTAALERSNHVASPAAHTPSFGGLGTYGPSWEEEWGVIKDHILTLVKPALRLEQLEPKQKLALEFLQREGVSDEAVLALYTTLLKQQTGSILAPLSSMVPVRPWGAEAWPMPVHFLAGPFGGGKTSTALRFALQLRKVAPSMRICIINADAARGNGRLYLRHYADLSDLVYKEASSPMELMAALASAGAEGYERIFVDMPGLDRRQALVPLLAEAGIRPDEASYFGGTWREACAIHLVFAPHYGHNHIRSLLARYKTPFTCSVVYTKLDEMDHYGQMVNVAHRTGVPTSAFSYGPGLGSSLTPATETLMWRLIFKRELPE